MRPSQRVAAERLRGFPLIRSSLSAPTTYRRARSAIRNRRRRRSRSCRRLHRNRPSTPFGRYRFGCMPCSRDSVWKERLAPFHTHTADNVFFIAPLMLTPLRGSAASPEVPIEVRRLVGALSFEAASDTDPDCSKTRRAAPPSRPSICSRIVLLIRAAGAHARRAFFRHAFAGKRRSLCKHHVEPLVVTRKMTVD